MKKKRIVSTFLLFLLIADFTAFLFLFWVNKAAAQPDVFVWPASSIVDPPELGKEFTIGINVTYVDELVNQWALKLAFDPTVLYTDANMISEGGYLSKYGAATDFTKTVLTGLVGAVCNTKPLTETVEGEGDLMYITFRVLDTGRSLLHLYDINFKGPDGDLMYQPNPVDGEFHTRTPHASFYYLPSRDPQETEFPYPDRLQRDPIVGEEVAFNATAFILGGRPRGSYDPDGTIAGYNWDFDDGQIATEPVVYHSFAEARSYSVELTITDNEGNTDTAHASVLVFKHDVAVRSIGVPRKTLTMGKDVKINVTIANMGVPSGLYEYVNVTLYHSYSTINTLIWYNRTEKKPAFSTPHEIDPDSGSTPLLFPPGRALVANYTWSTAGLAAGNYTIWANISLVDQSGRRFLRDKYQKELDFNLTNNILIWGNVTLKPLPDIGITDIKLSPTLQLPTAVRHGTPEVLVSIEVKNLGGFDVPSFNVTLYESSTLIGNWTHISLLKGETKILTPAASWSTESLPIGNYIFRANASAVEIEVEGEKRKEEDLDDNMLPRKVAITLLPLTSFVYSPLKPLVHEQVAFNATSSAAATGWTITGYVWRINGTVQPTLVGVAPSPIPFSLHAVYNITLTVTDSLGLTNSTSKLLHTYVLPTADFTCYPTSPKANVEATFNASLSYDTDPSSTITNYAWDFGDDQSGSGKIATHKYTTRGNYNVTLTVTDSDDHQGSLNKTIVVIQEPVAFFDYTPTSPTVDQIITFNATTSLPYGGQITEYKWNLGDGSAPASMQEPILKRKYTKGGAFQVTLMVIDSEGLNNTLTKSITITKLTTTISITASPSNVVIGQAVTIVGQVSASVGGATIALYYRDGTGSWIWLENRTTNDQGRYSYDWVTTTAGNFQFKAKWAGNDKYNEAESDPSTTITVLSQAGQIPLDIYLYVGGALVAVTIIAVVAYVLLKRRKA